MKNRRRGKYYKSLKEYVLAGNNADGIRNAPSIHVTGSVKGMRRDFWGTECDVVRIGSYIYKAS